MSNAENLCMQMVRAFETDDEALLRNVHASDARIWHSFDGAEKYKSGAQSVDESVSTMHWLHSATTSVAYETLRLEETESGFLEVHTLSGTTTLGETFSTQACLVGTLEGEKVSRVDEFISAEALAPLGRTLS